MRTKVNISYSKDELDSWEEGRKTWFIIETPKPLDENQLTQISRVYLHQLGVDYREFMSKEEVLDNGEPVKWKAIENKFYADEKVLLDENNNVLLIGDYYHHKIHSLIKGYIQGYEKGTGKKVELTEVEGEHPDFEIQDYEGY